MIKATALVCHQDQTFTLEDVHLPEPEADQIAVRCHYSGVSVGTEFAVIRGKLDWGPFPLVTGYMASGTVEKVGKDIDNFTVGQQIYYRGNDAMAFADGSSLHPATGAHCSHAVCRPNVENGAGPLPGGVPLDLASMFTMPAVGHHAVDRANPRTTDTVVIVGCGLIGLGLVASCAYRGCNVIAVDVNPHRLDAAKKMGADHVIDSAKRDMGEAVHELAPEGADVVFESTGIPALIDPSIALCRERGLFVWQGNYGDAKVSFHALSAHGKHLRTLFPCNDGLHPTRRSVLKNMASGTLPWGRIMTHTIESPDAPGMYDKINRDAIPETLGATIHWSDPA